MKAKLRLLLLAIPCFTLPSRAQADLHILNHLSIGAEVGTMGVGIDASMPVTTFVDIQGGFTMFPRVEFNTSLGTNRPVPGIDGKVRLKGKPLMKGGKVLVNVMPLPILSSFHITAGAYFESDEALGLYNEEPLSEMAAYNALHPDDKCGLTLGNYLLEPDAEGNIDVSFKVKPVKTYLGIGFGRGVPKRRIGFKFDVGCLLWGKPTLCCNGVEVQDTDQDGEGGGIIKVATKLKVYPMINFRLCGRIF